MSDVRWCVYDNPQKMRREWWINGELHQWYTAQLIEQEIANAPWGYLWRSWLPDNLVGDEKSKGA